MEEHHREDVYADTEDKLRGMVAADAMPSTVDIQWEEPGWYSIYDTQIRCSQGCCYDTGFTARPLGDRISELIRESERLDEKIREASIKLGEALKEKIKNAPKSKELYRW